MQDRGFKGIWIPAEIWLCKELTIQEKLFLVEIESLDNENGCYASNTYFSEFFEISKTRVSLVIKHLIEKGFITSHVIYKQGTKQILNRVLNICRPPYPTFVKDPYITNVKDPIQQKLNTPIQQKLKDNNTDINNTINNTINNIGGEPPPPPKKSPVFVKPTVEEVKHYCRERQNNIDAEKFIDYYTANGWMVGKTKMKDWKACVRTWEKNDYKPQVKQTPVIKERDYANGDVDGDSL